MKYQRWDLRRPGAPAARRSLERAGLSPLCAALLCARGLDDPQKAAQFLSCGPERSHDPFLLKDMDRAVARIRAAIGGGERVCVYGDYDVDGITATCLLTEALAWQGGDVVSYIPDRTEEGYGLNPGAVARLAGQGVKLIVTVDCGITAVDEVEFARSLGVDVVITDHHHCKDRLPAAAAVVDPRREDCAYPFPELAGVGVALKTAQALAPPEQREGVFRRFGELAAIGTVADVMRLTDENRTLVRQGLELLANTRRPGLRALLREAGLDPGAAPTAVTIGYGLAPRINAAGRMEQAMVALELLLTRDEERGEALAHTLCRLNRERQAIELAIYEQCVELLDAQPPAPAIVLAGEGWHQGVVGIVASRLTERYACPAFMICLEHGQGKGSCRSFGGFNLFAALDRCAPLLDGYGGHEMAAGFTIREENIPAFRDQVCRLVDLRTGGAPMEAAIDVDAEIDHCGQLTAPQVESLSELEPFGTGNPKPVFLLRGVCVLSCCDVGGGRHLKMKLRRDGVVLDAIFFSANAAACGVSAGDRLDAVFTPQINEFRGSRTVQLQVCDLRPAPTRAQLEQELFQRLQAGSELSRWEAGLLLPSRQDFARLWRFLEHNCVGGWMEAGPALLRQAARQGDGRSAYGRTLVCLHVMGDRGLIRLERDQLHLCRPENKVDLEQAQLMRRLRAFLEDETI
ncbi:MAG: single-stranded-DNA-specific exonuclease RecJ [Oscillospiraceae bacterium]|nr:single-stranded-DNA-specific exonuclease RecJ [Oscillospiraceae bacterium]